MEGQDTAGTETDKISVTSRISLRRKEVVSIILLHLQSNSNMMMMKSFWLIVTLIHILIALNCFKDCALLIVKIEFEKQSFARHSPAMIAKWLLLQILVQDLKRLQFVGLLSSPQEYILGKLMHHLLLKEFYNSLSQMKKLLNI